MKDDRLISLNAAIDALDKVAEMFPYRIPGKAKTYRQYNEAWSDAIDAAENALEALTSAQQIPWDANTRNSMVFTLRTVLTGGDMDAIDEDNIKRLSRWLEGGEL